ncbi:hypothetical protein PUN28_005901 [Cardiocondyla obscurior]|uniref:Uncharacterized protein n=1 Tax=Cardiocondyla obscurior TaxID=286306 RepID=A0AAW2G8N3_9HYME
MQVNGKYLKHVIYICTPKIYADQHHVLKTLFILKSLLNNCIHKLLKHYSQIISTRGARGARTREITACRRSPPCR